MTAAFLDPGTNSETNPRFEKIDKAALLSQCPLFSGLSHWELKSISQLMRLVEYKKDEIVYKEGAEGESFYVVVSGRFEASIFSLDKKKVLAYLRRGDYFGEMSLLTGQEHSATLQALSDSLTLELKKEDFKKTVEHNAAVSLELSRRLSTRLKGGESRARSLLKNDIISISSSQSRSRRTGFSLNLASSLFQETHQKTVVLEMSASALDPSAHSALSKRVSMNRFVDIETTPPKDFDTFLTHHPAGFQILSVIYRDKDAEAEDIISPLLNFLAIDYRFILVDLPRDMDGVVFKAFTQSDSIYFVTDSNMNNVLETKEIMAQIEKDIAFPEEKICVVVNEVFFGIRTTSITRKELFGKKMCFSLPPSPSSSEKDESDTLVSVGDPESEYARVIRHIARHISNNLVGLVLGSGAALGLAHVGVLKILEREKIPIDIIAGSSIGALISSLYAVGKTSQEIEAATLQINSRVRLGRLLDMSFFPIRGLIKGKKIIRHFKTHLGEKTFDNCRIPLKIVGANLSSRQIQVYESGYITDAVRASIAIPAIFKPVFLNGDVIVDGGILSPLPIRALRQAGANKIIAVNVFPTPKDAMEKRIMNEEAEEKEAMRMRQKNFVVRFFYKIRRFFLKRFSANIFDVLMNTIQTMESEIAEVEGTDADVLLRPVVSSANWVEFYKPEQFIQRGEEETIKLLPKIKALVFQQNI